VDVAAVLAGEDDDMPTVSEIWGAQFGPTDARVTAGQMLAEARSEARKARLTAEATLAAVQGYSVEQVLARIDEVAEAERARDETAAQRDTDLRDLIRQGQDGTLDAAEVVRRMGELLTAGTDPQG
jgi:hypothetical protein